MTVYPYNPYDDPDVVAEDLVPPGTEPPKPEPEPDESAGGDDGSE